MYEKLPQLLKDRYLFCRWRYELRNGKKTKVPYRADGRRADSGDRNCFTDLKTAVSGLTGFDGIGAGIFDDLVAVDIDDCIKNGKDLTIIGWTYDAEEGEFVGKLKKNKRGATAIRAELSKVTQRKVTKKEAEDAMSGD